MSAAVPQEGIAKERENEEERAVHGVPRVSPTTRTCRCASTLAASCLPGEDKLNCTSSNSADSCFTFKFAFRFGT